jgi:hypothetical protein
MATLRHDSALQIFCARQRDSDRMAQEWQSRFDSETGSDTLISNIPALFFSFVITDARPFSPAPQAAAACLAKVGLWSFRRAPRGYE